MKTVIYCEHHNGKIKKSSLELLSNAATWGTEVHALALGAPGTLDALTAELNEYGPHTIHFAEHAGLANYSSDGFAKVVADAAKSLGAEILLASVSTLGKYNLSSGRKSPKSPKCKKTKKSLQKQGPQPRAYAHVSFFSGA